jgi:hypothetical protein
VRAVQFNLCDSGIAGCFTGRSVRVAAAVITSERPGVVTLNEVCRRDVTALARALSATWPGRDVATAFAPALDRRTGGPYRCLNGQRYGIGVLAVLSAHPAAYGTLAGVYPDQDVGDPEERVWVCLTVPARLVACTTHTASTSTAVALAQCRFFMGAVLTAVRRRTGDLPLILGADLNLRAAGAPSPRSCQPAGFRRVDDGALQDVMASPGTLVRSHAVIDMQRSTDHPALLVDVTLPDALR